MADVRVVSEIAPEARIHPDARIGRWCVIGPDAEIGAGARLENQVTVLGRTVIGRDNVVGSGTVLGGLPQDLKYRGGDTWLLIGDGNRIGRKVTINVGTEVGGWVTYIGDGNCFGDACHVAHDCYILDRTHLGRKVLLAGHIVLETGSVIDDMTGVHHFARIGRYAHVGPRTPVRRDVPPFVEYYSQDYYGTTPRIHGTHEAGVVAVGLDGDSEAALRRALNSLFEDESALSTKVDQLAGQASRWPEVAHLCTFCRQSLDGVYGRYRELFRSKVPPEAEENLPADLLADIRKKMSESA